MLSFKPAFSLSFFTFISRLFSFSTGSWPTWAGGERVPYRAGPVGRGTQGRPQKVGRGQAGSPETGRGVEVSGKNRRCLPLMGCWRHSLCASHVEEGAGRAGLLLSAGRGGGWGPRGSAISPWYQPSPLGLEHLEPSPLPGGRGGAEPAQCPRRLCS